MPDSPTFLGRRKFLVAVAAVVPAVALPRTLVADVIGTRALSFVHTHTSERLRVEYFSGGQYLADGLASIDRFLRDFRTGESHPIDPRLLEVLHQLARAAGATRPFHVISGYRSPLTNAALRRASEGVAAGSLHMQGQAIDIRLEGVPLSRVHAETIALGQGGVGYYPGSDFVHVDTGRVRAWRG